MEKKRLILILTALLFGMVCLQAQPSLKRRTVKTKTVSDVRTLFKSKKVGNKASLRRAEGERLQNVQSALPFEQLPDMNGERRHHQTFAAANGFMVAGGYDNSMTPTGTAELYQNGSWKKVSLTSTVDNPTFSVTLADGSVLIGGGNPAGAGSGQSKGTAIYNPSSQKFTAGPNMTVERKYCNGILVKGNAYVSGNLDGEDLVYDRYDGTRFSAFGRAGEFSSPYLFADANGSLIAVAPYDNNGQTVKPMNFGNGDIYFCGIQYDVTDGKAYYYPFEFLEYHLLELPGEMRTSDYCWSYANFYFLLTKNDAGKYRLGVFLRDYISEGYDYFADEEFIIPTKSPTDNATITWRGGVFFNEDKGEAYLIGSSGSGSNWNVHIISYELEEGSWTIATATGFDRDLTGASWALLSDGRLACSGGFGPNYSVSKKAYIFAPPAAGTESDPNQGTNPDNPDKPDNPDPGPGAGNVALLVLTKDGAYHKFVLDGSRPQVKFEGSTLKVITSSVAEATFALSDIIRFTYGDYDPSGIYDLTVDKNSTTVDYKDGTLVISHLAEGASVVIYGIDGKQVKQLTAVHAGTYRLSLSSLPQGVYIVKADKISYKIMKR